MLTVCHNKELVCSISHRVLSREPSNEQTPTVSATCLLVTSDLSLTLGLSFPINKTERRSLRSRSHLTFCARVKNGLAALGRERIEGLGKWALVYLELSAKLEEKKGEAGEGVWGSRLEGTCWVLLKGPWGEEDSISKPGLGSTQGEGELGDCGRGQGGGLGTGF